MGRCTGGERGPNPLTQPNRHTPSAHSPHSLPDCQASGPGGTKRWESSPSHGCTRARAWTPERGAARRSHPTWTPFRKDRGTRTPRAACEPRAHSSPPHRPAVEAPGSHPPPTPTGSHPALGLTLWMMPAAWMYYGDRQRISGSQLWDLGTMDRQSYPGPSLAWGALPLLQHPRCTPTFSPFSIW